MYVQDSLIKEAAKTYPEAKPALKAIFPSIQLEPTFLEQLAERPGRSLTPDEMATIFGGGPYVYTRSVGEYAGKGIFLADKTHRYSVVRDSRDTPVLLIEQK